jgi:5-methylthioribose kinase
LTEDNVADYIAGQQQLTALTGGTRATQVVPLPDGIINTVYGVHGPGWSLLLKQAMPYVRAVPSFLLSQVRRKLQQCVLRD